MPLNATMHHQHIHLPSPDFNHDPEVGCLSPHGCISIRGHKELHQGRGFQEATAHQRYRLAKSHKFDRRFQRISGSSTTRELQGESTSEEFSGSSGLFLNVVKRIDDHDLRNKQQRECSALRTARHQLAFDGGLPQHPGRADQGRTLYIGAEPFRDPAGATPNIEQPVPRREPSQFTETINCLSPDDAIVERCCNIKMIERPGHRRIAPRIQQNAGPFYRWEIERQASCQRPVER